MLQYCVAQACSLTQLLSLFQIDTYVIVFTYNSTLESVTMEIEVVKIWLLSIYGVKLRRVSGSTWLYKQLYSNIIQPMKIE